MTGVSGLKSQNLSHHSAHIAVLINIHVWYRASMQKSHMSSEASGVTAVRLDCPARLHAHEHLGSFSLPDSARKKHSKPVSQTNMLAQQSVHTFCIKMQMVKHSMNMSAAFLPPLVSKSLIYIWLALVKPKQTISVNDTCQHLVSASCVFSRMH